nr:rho GTPase-activating protein gacU-like [Penaeus vannamei]
MSTTQLRSLCTRPTVTAQRPHTLNLVNRSHCRAGWKGGTWPPLPPLPHHHYSNSSYNSNINIINNNNNNNNNNSHHFNNNHTSLLSSTLHPMASMAQPLSTQTTSVDSIGSCSLDVNATGTTSPATLEAVDGSRRSLRSVSLENNLSSVAAVSTRGRFKL